MLNENPYEKDGEKKEIEKRFDFPFRNWFKKFKRFYQNQILPRLQTTKKRIAETFFSWRATMAHRASTMIGPMEKGIAAAKLSSPPPSEYEGVDLSFLPKYICYRAALLKSNLTLQTVLGLLICLFIGREIAHGLKSAELEKLLRTKEYILAPGVMDFTRASPDSVSDSYVMDAATEFLSLLGNVNPANINDQYQSLSRYMNPKLKITFEMETASWIEQVQQDDLSQILTVTDKEFVTNDKGAYQVTAFARADYYSEREYLGHEDKVIKMTLKLTPPESGKRWYLQIQKLTWLKAETFQRKQILERKQSAQSRSPSTPTGKTQSE